MIKKLQLSHTFCLIIFVSLSTSPAWSDTDTSEEQCVDENPEILIDLGGSLKPEKIVYATYDSCTQMHGYYCGRLGCDLTVYGNEDTEGGFNYIATDHWYIRPARVYGRGQRRVGHRHFLRGGEGWRRPLGGAGRRWRPVTHHMARLCNR